jgi:hypothetical protein
MQQSPRCLPLYRIHEHPAVWAEADVARELTALPNSAASTSRAVAR